MVFKCRIRDILMNFIEYLFVVTLIVDCNSMWACYKGSGIPSFLNLLLVAIAVGYFLIQKRITVQLLNRILVAFAIGGMTFVLYFIAVRYNIGSFSFFVIDFICVYAIAQIAIDKNRAIPLLYKYESLVFVIALISLVFWVFGSQLHLIQPSGKILSTWTGSRGARAVRTYYHIYFEPQLVGMIIRNCGIFSEAPMCSFQFCLGFLIELFFKETPSKRKIIIYALAVISTISTTGYCVLVVAIVLKYLVKQEISNSRRIIKVCIIPVLAVVAIFIIQTVVLDKFETSSGAIRIDDIYVGLKAWKDNVFFGSGFNNVKYVKRYMSSFRSYNTGFSNTILMILYQGGLLLMSSYFVLIVLWIKRSVKRKEWKKIAFFLCFLFMFSITIVPYKFLPLFILSVYNVGIECGEFRCEKATSKSLQLSGRF